VPAVVFPWAPSEDGRFVGDETSAVAFDESASDPILRYDIDDAVDAEHYPDGRYWRFDRPDLVGRLIVVESGRVVLKRDVYETLDGTCACVERRSSR
jgi:hypothetical protein